MSVEARHAILSPLSGLSSEENCFFGVFLQKGLTLLRSSAVF
jgi:hypothetical protein